MSFLSEYQIKEIKDKLTNDATELKRIYNKKRKAYHTRSVEISLAEDYIDKDGWQKDKEFKTKVRLRKEKSHGQQFEDDIWCQFYNLGYRYLNFDENFRLPFSKDKKDTKQIDVIAIKDETVFLIECKSATKQPYRDEFDLLRLRLNGFRKAIYQVFNNQNLRIKYIFATRNFQFPENSKDLERLQEAQSYHYNKDTYDHVNNLIKHYKEGTAYYQFLGQMFKGTTINDQRIEIPAIEGRMGGKKYYMFSIEPELLLKISFILHRAKSNNLELPNYQRLLNPNRRKAIMDFISGGGYFPNSIVVNFSQENREESRKNKLEFKPTSNTKNSRSKHGVLYIPNAYAIAYIIDGQHRLYGYAGLDYAKKNTIPVVAFDNLERTEQLKIFMEINEKQKSVSKSLRIALDEDMLWDDKLASNRLKALRSSIASKLADGNGPLSGFIAIGEEKNATNISGDFIVRSLQKSELLPKIKGNRGNQYDIETAKTSIYDISNHNDRAEMERTREQIVKLINACYEFIRNNYLSLFQKKEYFLVSSRGVYAFILLISRLNSHLVQKKKLAIESNHRERFNAMEPYLQALLVDLDSDTKLVNEKKEQLAIQGAKADKSWIIFFEFIVNNHFPDFKPDDLIDWKERKGDDLQQEGRNYIDTIEGHLKKSILTKLEILYGDTWELRIGDIPDKCIIKMNETKRKDFADTKKVKEYYWTDFFDIVDYKKIIKKEWAEFQHDFSIQIDDNLIVKMIKPNG